jgi:hypothetical protein
METKKPSTNPQPGQPAGQNADGERINWHQAFYGALHLELDEYRSCLEFETEHQLTTEPLRIDVLIIKKNPETVIKKNIGAVFRQVNVIEFKSPDDYISIDDFSKIMAYCYLYTAIRPVPVTDLSLTLAWSGYPREVAAHLREAYGWEVRERGSGIHTVSGAGMAFPIQIIESRKLPDEENLWLKSLGRRLSAERLDRVLRKSAPWRKEAEAGAYLHAVLEANIETLEPVQNLEFWRCKRQNSTLQAPKEPENRDLCGLLTAQIHNLNRLLREVLAMGDLTLEKVLEESGLTAKWEERGKVQGIALGEARGMALGKAEGLAQGIAQVLDLLKSGKPPEEILQLYGTA